MLLLPTDIDRMHGTHGATSSCPEPFVPGLTTANTPSVRNMDKCTNTKLTRAELVLEHELIALEKTQETVRELTLPIDAYITATNMTFSINGTPTSYLTNLTIQLDSNDTIWAYRGQGYGALGYQYLFATGNPKATVDFSLPSSSLGGDELAIMLPQNAEVTSATCRVSYDAEQHFEPVIKLSHITEYMVTAVTVGDIDSDGESDVIAAVGNYFMPEVTVVDGGIYLLKSVAGTIANPAIPLWVTGKSVNAVALADLNNNGKLEVIGCDTAGSFYIIFDNGTRTLINASTMKMTSLAIGDFNHDGYSDIVGASWDSKLYVLMNNRSYGEFQALASFVCDSDGKDALYAVTVGDIDIDGDLDIVAGSEEGNFYIAENHDGNFENIVEVSMATDIDYDYSIFAVKLIDWDHDGDLDIIGSGSVIEVPLTKGAIVISENIGFAFQPIMEIVRTQVAILSIEFVDIDEDGTMDLIASGSDGKFYSLRRYHLNHLTTYGSQELSAIGGCGAGSMTAIAGVDIDTDGDIDFIGGNTDGAIYITTNCWERKFNFSLALGDNELYAKHYLTFEPTPGSPLELNATEPIIACAIGDLDSDYDLDIVSISTDFRVHIALNDGSNNFKDITYIDCVQYSIVSMFDLELTDYDLDGDLDILIAGSMTTNSNDHGCIILIPNVAQTNHEVPFSPDTMVLINTTDTALIANSYMTSIASGDLDLDGDLDIVTGAILQYKGSELYYGNIYIALYDKINATYLSATPIYSSPGGIFAIALGDIESDGDLDILCGFNDILLRSYFYILFNTCGNFNTTFIIKHPTNLGPLLSVAFVDIDKDADLDLVGSVGNIFSPEQDGFVCISKYSPILVDDTTIEHQFTPVTSIVHADSGMTTISYGDLDHDGDLDLIGGNVNSNIYLILNEDGKFNNYSTALTLSYGAEPVIYIELVDIDLDTNLELLMTTASGYYTTRAINASVYILKRPGYNFTYKLDDFSDELNAYLKSNDEKIVDKFGTVFQKVTLAIFSAYSTGKLKIDELELVYKLVSYKLPEFSVLLNTYIDSLRAADKFVCGYTYYDVNIPLKFSTDTDGKLYDVHVVVNYITPPRFYLTYPEAGYTTIYENNTQIFRVDVNNIDNDILTYTWLLDNNIIDSGSNTSFKFTADYFSAGNHTITVVIFDGYFTVTHEWGLNILNVNRPLTFAEISPLCQELEIYENSTLTFSIIVIDPDNDTISYLWYVNNIQISTATGNNYTFYADYGSAGNYEIKVHVSDGTMCKNYTWYLTVVREDTDKKVIALPKPVLTTQFIIAIGIIIILAFAVILAILILLRSRREILLPPGERLPRARAPGRARLPSHIPEGKVYVLREIEKKTAYELFSRTVNLGVPGLVVTTATRTSIKNKVQVNNFKQVQLLQLIEPRLGGEEEEVSEVRRVGVTGLGIGSTPYERVLRNKIAPTELTVLLSRIKWFIDEHSAAVILLDNIDLLILHNNFMQVLNVIRALKDYIKPTKARLIIPIDPLSFSKRELRLLRVELTVI